MARSAALLSLSSALYLVATALLAARSYGLFALVLLSAQLAGAALLRGRGAGGGAPLPLVRAVPCRPRGRAPLARPRPARRAPRRDRRCEHSLFRT